MGALLELSAGAGSGLVWFALPAAAVKQNKNRDDCSAAHLTGFANHQSARAAAASAVQGLRIKFHFFI